MLSFRRRSMSTSNCLRCSSVDVVATRLDPVSVDVFASWQGGIPDAPANGIIYGRLNNQWVGALGLLTPYAPLDSPNFVGVPTTPTPPPGATSEQIVNAEWVSKNFMPAGTGFVQRAGDTMLGPLLLMPGSPIERSRSFAQGIR